MKKVFLSMLLVGAVSYANAQKSEISEAKKLWGVYELTMSVDPSQRAGAAPAGTAPAAKPGTAAPVSFVSKQIKMLNDGLSHTDKAVAHEKTKDLAEPWLYKALFHSTIGAVDTLDLENSRKNQKLAEQSIEKVKALDTKGEFKELTEQANNNIDIAVSRRGIAAYNSRDYENAYTEFFTLAERRKTDPAWYLNAAVAANQLEKYPEAINSFKKVVSMDTTDAKGIYSQIVSITLEKLKDTTAGLALLEEALAKFPEETGLIGVQTDIFIAQGNIEKSQASLSKLIAKDPSKAVYQYLMGETYYKQALAMQDERNKIDAKKVKEFDAVTAKMTALIDKSLPFYKKSHELDPVFVPTLETLKQIYGFKNDVAGFNDIKKKLDAIPQN
ncbi:MAG: hypothetical protein EOO90_10130 [Pedobacter sp.]|nr:MAG: hypothetical protein EOO90_10130 [Pedobacter sp.]